MGATKNNLTLWERVEKTDPKHTKDVRSGGRKFTAVNAMYQTKNATREFGKYGEGWGIRNIQIEYINNLVNNQILAVFRGEFFYPNGTFEVGTSILVQSWIASKSYNKVDEDFVKKAETDMTTKALSKLGFNSDIFMGMWDDNKYVAQVAQEFAEKPKIDASIYEQSKQALTTNPTPELKQQYITYLEQFGDNGYKRELLELCK
ncbi:MAG: hypothetical protein DSZ12_00095 [Sulfurovum sp.]|nr:MAG: hypothetical protein DSZ12_00095 [Sulfurovum sp.]